MNSQGYTKDNIHKGNTKIVAGGIDVDGLIRIGDQSTGGDGYVLPAVKGSEGQVLTMNSDNSTSFQDGGGSGINVIGIGGGEDIVVPPNAGAGEVPTSIIGSRSILLSDFPVGASVHLNINTRFDLAISGPGSTTGTMSIDLNAQIRNSSNTFLGGLFLVCDNQEFFSGNIAVPADFLGYLKLEAIITRVAEDKLQGTMTAFNKKYTGQDNPCQQWPNTPTSITADFSDIDISGIDSGTTLTWEKFSFFNNFYSTGTVTLRLPSVSYTLRNISSILSPPPATLDHTQLNNLEFGDSGHTQFALLQGRSGGGQILSGGITSAETLTLKSHTAGLNNIVIKDINTTFEKRIDMTQKLIENCSGFINPTAPTGIAGLACSIGESTTDMSMVFQSNQASIQQLGNQIIRFEPTIITSSKDIDMLSNRIIGVPEIVGDGGDMTIRNGGGESILLNSATNTIDILNNALNMNNNGINNVSSINNLTPVGGLFSGTSDSLNVSATTAEISILPLTFVGVGPAVPPNGFSVGDCFELKLSGPFNSANSDTLTIRLKGGPTATTLLATLVVPLNASSSSVFQLFVLFQIRAIGGAGVADIITDADLTYNQSGGGGSFVGEQSLSQNNTTFDTTLANVLDVTAEFSSTSASNDMTTRVGKLQKTF